MNPVAMMMPMMTTAKLEVSQGQTRHLSGDNKGLSDFAKLLHNHVMTQQAQRPVQLKEADQNVSAEEMTEELGKLEIKELEMLISMLMSETELSDEDLTVLQELANELVEIQQNGIEVTEAANKLSLIIETVVHMTSAELMKDVLTYMKQPEFQDFTTRIYQASSVHFNNYSKIDQDAKQVLQQVETLLKNIHSAEDLSKAAPKVLELFQQWQKVVAQAGQNADKMPVLNVENRQLANVWQQLVETSQNRTATQLHPTNNLDTKVTVNDVVSLLSKAVEATVSTEKNVQPMPVTTSSMPMSRVEQFVIHLNQNQQAQPVDKQLVEQFQRIMDMNRISSLQNNRGQLAITLKPHNLGEMLVRFTQVNGELMVKILVTSESAKRMLEGNIQQLRNMFSPHQVVIDKQDSVVTENQESEKQQARDEHQESRDDTQTNQRKQQSGNESFSTIFEELVVNEEV